MLYLLFKNKICTSIIYNTSRLKTKKIKLAKSSSFDIIPFSQNQEDILSLIIPALKDEAFNRLGMSLNYHLINECKNKCATVQLMKHQDTNELYMCELFILQADNNSFTEYQRAVWKNLDTNSQTISYGYGLLCYNIKNANTCIGYSYGLCNEQEAYNFNSLLT